jgi:hypothetical protein
MVGCYDFENILRLSVSDYRIARPIKCTLIFSLEILEKIMMTVF